jgi:UDP-N-acetylmuramyl pentapeptide phosphotransferase/UDP-N-acetylglucosamine-1-phosphate transferase
MGDVGSSLLGLLAAALSLWADQEKIFPLWVGILVFSPFIVDATVTLLRRTAAGERIWEAHRSHFYQRLVQLGWGHRRTVVWEYVLMLACAVSAFIASIATPVFQWCILVLWVILYGALIWTVGWLEKQRASDRDLVTFR